MTVEQKALEIAMYDGWSMTTNTEAQKYSKHGEVSLPEDMLINRYMKFTTLQRVASQEFAKYPVGSHVDKRIMRALLTIGGTFLLPAKDGVISTLVEYVYSHIYNMKSGGYE